MTVASIRQACSTGAAVARPGGPKQPHLATQPPPVKPRAWRLDALHAEAAVLTKPAYTSRDYANAARSAPAVAPHDAGPDAIEFPMAFGVEMEMGRTSVPAARDVVTGALGDTSSLRRRGVADEAGKLWEVKPDEGSIVEIASPVLGSMRGLRQVQSIARAMRVHGAVSHARCGTHVHIDARGMDVPHILRLLALLARHEIHLYKALGVHAGRARYCMPMERKRVLALLEKPPNTRDKLCKMYRGPSAERDRGLNVENLRNHDSKVTLEFRYFNGTLDAHLLGCYTGLVMGLARYAMASRKMPTRNEVLAQPDLPMLLGQIGMPPTHPVATLLMGRLLQSK